MKAGDIISDDQGLQYELKSLLGKGLWSNTFLARECVTCVIADIVPAQPNSKPFKSFASEPGKIKKFLINELIY